MELIIHSDGGARGNPGPAAIGVVVSDTNGNELKAIKEYIGEGTNNQAEYKALIKGISEAAAMGAQTITCYLDSELVVKQLNGQYKIKEPGLQVLAMHVIRSKNKFQSIEFKHVRREHNKRADQLVNEALDEESNRLEV
ncbi:MAG TPA: ribonuclease HI family protein [Candidatus Binatia bacterium]|nr:ribonuclease HI family protein [Candidatus Binatia bacterium]